MTRAIARVKQTAMKTLLLMTSFLFACQHGQTSSQVQGDLGFGEVAPDLASGGANDLSVVASTDGSSSDGSLAPDLAVDAPEFRIATFNLHCLFDSPDVRESGIAAEAVSRGVDALAVQEACESASGNGSDNAAAAIATNLTALTGHTWSAYWVMTHLAWSNQYREGVAVIARADWMTSDKGEIDLPYEDGLARKAAWVRLATDHGGLYLYSTHFSISSDDQDRVHESQTILADTATHLSEGLPMVVCGDFNSTPTQPAIPTMIAGPPAFVDTWASKNPGQNGYTIDATNPHARIDYVFVNGSALGTINTMEIAFDQQYMNVWMSDHFGLFVDFTAK